MFDIRRAGVRAFDVKGATILSCAVVGTLWFVVAQTFHVPQPGSAAATVAGPARIAEPSRSAWAEQSMGGSGSAAGTAVVNQVGALRFHGYACTLDCSGHRAGFDWAQDEGITRPDQCPIAPVNLRSLTEGCWAETGREGP